MSLTSVSAISVPFSASAISVLELVVVHAEVVVVSPRSSALMWEQNRKFHLRKGHS